MAKIIINRILPFFVLIFILASCSSQNKPQISSNSGSIDGVSWQAFNIAAPKNTSLFGIKCFTAINCVAVGASNLTNNLYSSKASYNPIAFFSDDAGVTWNQSTLKSASASSTGILSSIDCTSNNCIAVGGTDPTGNGAPIVMLSSDKGATFNSISVPGVTSGAFNSIFCYAHADQNANYCLLGGQSGKSTNTTNLLEKFGVTKQSFDSIAVPNLNNSFISSVECTKDSSCMVLGGYYNSSQSVKSEILHSSNDGTTFTMNNISTLPPTLLSISCTKQNCFLGGADQTTLNSLGTPIGYPAVFSLTSTGKGKISTNLSEKAGQGLMTSIYCSYEDIGNLPQCVATGGLGISNSSKSIIAVYRNNIWQSVVLKIINANLYSVTCNTLAKYCFAVGNIAATSTKSFPEIIKLKL